MSEGSPGPPPPSRWDGEAGPPVLLACSHGTDDPAGREAVAGLRAAVARARPALEVAECYVDVQAPALPDVVEHLAAAGRTGVIVPLLLSAGYHVHVDVADAVTSSGGAVRAASALGPDDALVAVVADRLRDAGVQEGDVVVLGAAGSSDRRAVDDVQHVATALAGERGGPVTAAYLSAASPRVADAVAAARAGGAGRVVVASYLLAPGYFQRRLADSGADLVTPALLAADAPADPRLVDLVLRRYDEAAAG